MSFLSVKLMTVGFETISYVIIYLFCTMKKIDSRLRLGVFFGLIFLLSLFLDKSFFSHTLVFYTLLIGMIHFILKFDVKSSCFYGVQSFFIQIIAGLLSAVNILFFTGSKTQVIDIWNRSGLITPVINLGFILIISWIFKRLFEQVRTRVGIVKRIVSRIRTTLIIICSTSIIWVTFFISYLNEHWSELTTIPGLTTLLYCGFIFLVFSNAWIGFHLIYHYCFQFRYKAVTAMAETDPLTGLLSRSAGMQMIKRSFNQAKLSGNRLTLVFIDVNDLKVVNDKMGHNTGDQMISKLADVLKTNIRSSDAAMRFGGDEFVLILQECPHYRAEEIMKKIIIYLNRFNLSGEFNFKLSISYGIAEYVDKRHSTVQELISEADVEMYKHKKKIKMSRM